MIWEVFFSKINIYFFLHRECLLKGRAINPNHDMSNNRLYAELKFMESLSIFCLTLLCLFVLIFMQSDRNLGLDDILKKELMEKMQLII